MLYILALVLIEIFLFLQNYTPGTYLLGWDNIMPEFNLLLNFKRAFFSLWQDYRGLGLVDGLSHTANLFHTIYISILSFFIPESMIRYIFITLTHLLGGIGFFLLIRKLNKNSTSAFLGALFYMFNLGIIQMYFAPLEVFAIHFTALPFLSLTIIDALKNPSKRNLFIFAVTSLLCTPQSFVPTIFIVYSVLFGFLMLFDLIFQKDFKKILIITAIYFATNAFWLFPYVYSVTQTGSIIPETRINQYSSEEIFFRNKDFGDLLDVFSFKGFMLTTPEIDMKTNETVILMEEWNKHINTIQYKIINILIFILFLVGVWKTVNEKRKDVMPFLAAMAISVFFLANNTYILETFNNIVRSSFPIIGEAFRIPFTKFITLFVFCFSIFLAFGISFVGKMAKSTQWATTIIGTLILMYSALPVFQGQFYSSLLRVELPNEYRETMKYLQTLDPTKRIAMLPMETFWNWEYRNWGHRGSGFWWYGVPQSLLMRPFDPWSLENEQVYNEMHYALERNDLALFEDTITKYNLDYLLIDTNVRYPSLPKLYDYNKLQEFLATSNLIKKDNNFSSLLMYKIENNNIKNDVTILADPNKISTNATFYYEDKAFSENSFYINDLINPDIIYPFSSLFSEKTQANLSVETTLEEKYIQLKPKNNPLSNITAGSYNLLIDDFDKESMIPAKVTFENDTVTFTAQYPDVIIGNTTYKIDPVIAKIPANNARRITMTEVNQFALHDDIIYLFKGYPNTFNILTENGSTISQLNTDAFFKANIEIPISLTSSDEIKLLVPKIDSISSIENAVTNNLFTVERNNAPSDTETLHIIAKDSNSEIVLWSDDLFHSTGYVISINANWKTGLPLSFYVDNTFDKRPAMETLLTKDNSGINTLFLPPVDIFHRGYGLHIVAKTIGNEKTEAIIRDFDMYPIPFYVISNIRLAKKTETKKTQFDTNFSAKQLTPYQYEVKLNNNTNSKNVLYFDHSFHNGWKAYIISNSNWYSKTFPQLFGTELNKHVKVNNWANGWELDAEITNNDSVIITFWPSILQHAGFILLIIVAISLLFIKTK